MQCLIVVVVLLGWCQKLAFQDVHCTHFLNVKSRLFFSPSCLSGGFHMGMIR
uniref:Uncharacterized protein n=1 Tax=Anguilla anguilla TaxID=7936 RepID=A0A0E9VFY3_ANGAN